MRRKGISLWDIAVQRLEINSFKALREKGVVSFGEDFQLELSRRVVNNEEIFSLPCNFNFQSNKKWWLFCYVLKNLWGSAFAFNVTHSGLDGFEGTSFKVLMWPQTKWYTRTNNHFMALYFMSFHMAWSGLLRVASDWLRRWFLELTTADHRAWKGPKDKAKKCFLYLCTVLIEVT